MSPIRLKDGFTGQKMLELPDNIIVENQAEHLASKLYPCNIGYFPNANFHYIDRVSGSSNFILIYCVSGEGWYKLDQKYLVKAGQYFILPANKHHSYGADLKQPWTIYWLHFAGETAEDIWQIYSSNHFPLAAIPFSQHRNQLFDQIYNLLEKGYSKEHIRFTSLAMNHLIGSFLYPKLFDSQNDNKVPEMTDCAIEFMEANISGQITLKQLAEHVRYSAPHLMAEFKKKTGYSPIDYHNRLRIQKACQYLDLTDIRIKEVSYMLGFKDPYYFSRIFTKIIGKSPKAYKLRDR